MIFLFILPDNTSYGYELSIKYVEVGLDLCPSRGHDPTPSRPELRRQHARVVNIDDRGRLTATCVARQNTLGTSLNRNIDLTLS